MDTKVKKGIIYNQFIIVLYRKLFKTNEKRSHLRYIVLHTCITFFFLNIFIHKTITTEQQYRRSYREALCQRWNDLTSTCRRTIMIN